MTLDEPKERELAEGLEERLGSRMTELLMEHVASASQVEALDRKVDALDHKVDLLKYELTTEIHRVGRNQLLGFAAIMAIFNTGLFAVAAWVRF